MAQLSRTQLLTNANSAFPDNTSAMIDPADLRTYTRNQAESFALVSEVAAPFTGWTVVARTASFEVAEGDQSAFNVVTSASGTTVTFPADLPVGLGGWIAQGGAGTVTFAAGSGAALSIFGGATFNKTAGLDAVVGFMVTAAGVIRLSGDLAE